MGKRNLVLVGYAYDIDGSMVHSTIYETKLHARNNISLPSLPIFPVYRDMNDAPHYRTELTDRDDEAERKKRRGA